MTDIVLHITSGSGPRECAWVVARLVTVFIREAEAAGLKANLLGEWDKVLPSALLSVSGEDARAFAQTRIGTIRWIGESPFRPRHKRKNWFVGVSYAPSLEDIAELNIKDVRFSAMKASGPGGQHVNSTNSAVRAVHEPSGIMVSAQEERSQHANKRLCLIKLAMVFEAQQERNRATHAQDRWQAHKSLERGNEVRVYEGPKFRLR